MAVSLGSKPKYVPLHDGVHLYTVNRTLDRKSFSNVITQALRGGSDVSIRLGPSIELGDKSVVVVCQVSLGLDADHLHVVNVPEAEADAARKDLVEVAEVGGDAVDVDDVLAAVAAGVGVASADLDGAHVVLAGAARLGQPVLGGDVAVPEQLGWQARDGVVGLGDAVDGASLAGDEVAELSVANARGAVGVDVDVVAGVAQVGNPVADVGTAADGEDNLLSDIVDGSVARDASCLTTDQSGQRL
ncbi:unnamed protein product [Clonostachys rosea]|uniref:Uncharacterized protein n=1 Tax=Bionectria ochroleuca TaxID=29856 RepID=A0ABY6UQF3_BIOOC|nr:unnamed protein product [Clonostachys rosea]